MTAANRAAAARFVIETLEDLTVNENEPASVGGISKGGITLFDYADYCKANGLPAPTADTIRNLTEDQMVAVYEKQFMDPLRFDDLPSGVDAAVFGYAVQSGLTGGVQLLSIATATWPIPGKINPLVDAANKLDPKALVYALGAAWLSRKFVTGNWASYGHGWTNRSIKQTAFSLSLVQ